MFLLKRDFTSYIGPLLKSLFFNSLPTDPAEPDLVDRGGDPRAVVKDIPGDDQVSCQPKDAVLGCETKRSYSPL